MLVSHPCLTVYLCAASFSKLTQMLLPERLLVIAWMPELLCPNRYYGPCSQKKQHTTPSLFFNLIPIFPHEKRTWILLTSKISMTIATILKHSMFVFTDDNSSIGNRTGTSYKISPQVMAYTPGWKVRKVENLSFLVMILWYCTWLWYTICIASCIRRLIFKELMLEDTRQRHLYVCVCWVSQKSTIFT